MDLIKEVPGKEVDDLLGTSAKMHTKVDARRFIAIAKNSEVFFFAYELDFNRCIQKMKDFFPNIDTNFLTLTNLDAQSLIDEAMKEDVYSFMVTVTATLNKKSETTALGPPSKDDPSLNVEVDKGPSFSFSKPTKAPRSKGRQR